MRLASLPLVLYLLPLDYPLYLSVNGTGGRYDGSIVEDRTSEVAAWRRKLSAKSTEQIAGDLARSIYGGPDAWKVVIAKDVLQERREAEERRRREDERVRLEQGEVATLEEHVTALEGEELRDKSKALFWTRIGVAVAVLAALAAWREPLWFLAVENWAVFKWAMGWQ